MRSLFTALILFMQCASGYAALGAAPTDFGTHQNASKARMLASAAGTYQVQETTLANGTVIREYVTRTGTVFAVSWHGPFLPDFRTLLGAHFDTMKSEAAKTPKAGHSQMNITRPELVIVSGGHMRAYVGRAWLVGQLPAQFNVDDID